MNKSFAIFLLAIPVALSALEARAQTFELRTFVESHWIGNSKQTAGAEWTAQYGDAGGNLLPVLDDGVYGYPCTVCTRAGGLVDAGSSSWNNTPGFAFAGLPTFDGLFLHPGYDASTSVALVFNPQTPVWLQGVTVQTEFVLNGLSSNGVDVAVSHVRNGQTTLLGSYVVSGADYLQQSYVFALGPLLFNVGDKLVVDVGPNGSYSYDHLNINVYTAAVPEADTWAMLFAGLGLVGFTAYRRKR